VGWVPDDDREASGHLQALGYRVTSAFRRYRRDLGRGEVPEADPPTGWQLRPLAGVGEADSRRRAGLIHYGLGRMREAEMTVCRVVTDALGVATDFYTAVGFADVGSLQWWKEGPGR
jgi:hypothetical protein